MTTVTANIFWRKQFLLKNIFGRQPLRSWQKLSNQPGLETKTLPTISRDAKKQLEIGRGSHRAT